MKKILVLISFVSMFLSGTAFAAPANIGYIVCTGGQFGVGAVTVTFTGLKTFNVTEVNAWGVPLSQQAVVVQDPDFDGKTLTFEMKGMITLTEFTLELYNGTREGRLSTVNGSVALACSSAINAR